MPHLILGSFLLAIGSVGAIVLTIVGLGGLIFFHELGHFLACRLTGTRVDAFSVGFGKELIGWTRGHTRYKICLIPLGGYVKMAAENPGEVNTGAPDEFPNKSFSARLFIMSNGVIFNFLLAFILFVVCFRMGVEFEPPRIGTVVPNGVAWEAGLMDGDLVTHLNGERILTFGDLRQEVALSASGETLNMTVKRGDETLEIAVTPRYNETQGVPAIGVGPSSDPELFPAEGSLIAKAGGRDGDIVLAINGIRVANNDEFAHAVAELSGRAAPGAKTLALSLRVRRANGAEETLTVDAPFDTRPQIGIHLPLGRSVAFVCAGFGLEDVVRPGDVVEAVNGTPVSDLSELQSAVLDAPVTSIRLRRGERELTVEPTRPLTRQVLARAVRGSSDEGNVVAVRPGMAAERAGLVTGDRIVKVGTREVDDWAGILAAVTNETGPFAVTVERGGESKMFTIEPGRFLEGDRWLGYRVPISRALIQETSIGGAIKLGWTRTLALGKSVILTVRSLITADVRSDQVGGPIMLAAVTYQSKERGLGYYFYILALISVNLAVLNLLPIPVLDGGQIVLLCAEKLRGKPLPERIVGYYQMVGVVLILGLIVLALKNDITNVILR